MNQPDFIPDQSFIPDSSPQQQSSNGPAFIPYHQFVSDEEKYGTTGQQMITAAEGAAKGIAGPVATAAEVAMGVKPEDIRLREETNPWVHGVPEAATFAGSMLAGTGEAALLSHIGEGVLNAAKAAPKAAEIAAKYPIISKIASHGIKTGAEMAALQAGNEISKAITEDPNQTLGTAAINVGLSGIIGGVGGATIGAVSPLFRAGIEKSGLPKIIDEAKAQFGFRKVNPDVSASVSEELGNRINEMRSVRYNLGNMKGEALERAMPEVTPENTTKINDHLVDTANMIQSSIDKASENAKLKGAIPYIEQDLKEFLEKVSDPDATYAEKFGATNKLKQNLDSYKNFKTDVQSSALGKVSEEINDIIRPSLEDTGVWGDAGRIQKETNAAIKRSIDAEKLARSKFTKKDINGISVSEDKVASLVNRGEKGKALDAIGAVKDYLKHTDNLAETLNKIHSDYGLDAPIRLTPTPATEFALGKSSSGTKLGNWLFDKGLGSLVGHGAAEVTGAGLGSLVGHPGIGAYIGDKMLSPIFTSIAKPLMENATNSVAAKSSIDYVASVIKGEKIFNSATENLFKGSSEILAKDLMPNKQSREKLEKSLEHVNDINNLASVGGHLNHYLPQHSNAAVMTATTAKEYLSSLKPQVVKQSPLDRNPVVDKAAQEKYNRALDIAQQPLYVLYHVKNGTLQPQDIHTLNTIYPGLHKKLIQKTFENMTKALDEGRTIPYHQKQSLSLLMGQPLDSTMMPMSMQAAIMSNSKGMAVPQQGMGHQKSTSAKALSSIEKVDKLYATPSQSRMAGRYH